MKSKTCGECCHLETTEHFSFQCKHCNGTVSTSSTACDHFSKRYGICPECGSYLFSYEHTEDNDWQLCTCTQCGCSGTPEEFLHNSVFVRITTSPEVLAESSVYCLSADLCRSDDGKFTANRNWKSPFIDRCYDTKEEAISATLKRLKEIENEK